MDDKTVGANQASAFMSEILEIGAFMFLSTVLIGCSVSAGGLHKLKRCLLLIMTCSLQIGQVLFVSFLVLLSFRDGMGNKLAASLSLNPKPRVSFLWNVGLRAFFGVTKLGINLWWFVMILSVLTLFSRFSCFQ
jgi:hypothetical protein